MLLLMILLLFYHFITFLSNLKFKYSCQLIDLNLQQGYPLYPNTNRKIYLNEFKKNSSLQSYEKCFNSFVKNVSFIN